ncbi:MAG TPA: penicillin-binding protein 2 [Chthonomonadales bacterium]|nr:penicillin-binding protein 2 [Chthonomonadales bacterium]
MAVRVQRPELVKQRIERLFLIITLCYVGLVGRLIYLQVLQGDYYRSRAEAIRKQYIEQQAQRGAILDRNGRPLAMTTHVPRLICDPTRVQDPVLTANVLAGILNRPEAEILPLVERRKLPDGRWDRAVVVAPHLSPAEEEAFIQASRDKTTRPALVGLVVQDNPERVYAVGREAVHVVGLLVPGEDGVPRGAMGIEQSQDKVLRGRDGYLKAEMDARRRVIPTALQERMEAQDGQDVRLTLDSNIQHFVETELAACTQKYKPVGATAIVLDPNTGDVLAMVSYPSFDPVTRRELKGKYEQDAMDPRHDRALRLFEPGSTLKPVTVAAALESGVIEPETRFYCPGYLKIGRRKIRCVLHGPSERHGHGTLTPREIIARSCNVGTARIGLKVGMSWMCESLREFGLLGKTGVELPGDTAGTLGFGMEAQQRGEGKLARIAFGQSVMVTPLALTAAYASFANKGVLMRPRLITAYQNTDGRTTRAFDPQTVRRVISPKTAETVCSMLEEVVVSGTGRKVAKVPGYRVAGKTGTAQKALPGRRGYVGGKYIASFIGFLPVSSPRAVICVVVDEPQGCYYGAQVAAPVFQAIAQKLMWYWKVPPDDPASLPRQRLAGKP